MDYIILDEVHERGIESDFSLALLLSAVKSRLSSKLATSSTPLRLILMSATISTDSFAKYLKNELENHLYINNDNNYCSDSEGQEVGDAPVLFIPGNYLVLSYWPT